MSWFERKLKKLFQGDVAIGGDITANDGTFSGTVKADTISEYTADNGVVIDGNIKVVLADVAVEAQ